MENSRLWEISKTIQKTILFRMFLENIHDFSLGAYEIRFWNTFESFGKVGERKNDPSSL